MTDSALKYGFPRIFKGCKAVGLQPILTQFTKDEEEDFCKKAENYDITDVCSDHSYFNITCHNWLYKIKDSY